MGNGCCDVTDDHFYVSRSVACEIEHAHGEWLVLMCCDALMCVSKGCLWKRASTCGMAGFGVL